jgi:hypothetical protein
VSLAPLLVLAVAVVAACGDDDDSTGSAVPAGAVQLQDAAWKDGPTTATAERLPCTPIDEPANFALFWPGPEVAGLDLTAILRRCDKPHPAEPGRANSVSLIYGTCEIPPEQTDGGCAPPLEIQIAPTCERAAAGIDDGGLHADDSVIDIFGRSELRSQAKEALVEIPPSTPPSELSALSGAGPAGDLPSAASARNCAN